jgi:hypothetical protein
VPSVEMGEHMGEAVVSMQLEAISVTPVISLVAK